MRKIYSGVGILAVLSYGAFKGYQMTKDTYSDFYRRNLLVSIDKMENIKYRLTTTGVIDSFLASLVSLVSINPDRTTTFNALSILFTYLKNGKICYF